MKPIFASIAVAAIIAGSSLSIAQASTAPLPTSSRLLIVTSGSDGMSVQEARRGRGKDDAPGDDRGGNRGQKGGGRDDGPNHTLLQTGDHAIQVARHGRGKDDAPGDDHGRHGNGRDDGANHA
jgi:hypothetical protein